MHALCHCYHSLHHPSSAHNTVLIPAPRSAEPDGGAAPATGAAAPAEGAAFLFPDEQFFNVIQALGFNRNDGTLNLMLFVYHERQGAREPD